MSALSQAIAERAKRVRLMAFDVDGVLTDGTLWYGASGEELKRFHAFDGHGMKMLGASGVACALLSGRRSLAVATRASELGVPHVLQGIEDKRKEFERLLARLRFSYDESGFMGDELVDLPVLTRCGFAAAPREAPETVRSRVHYVAAAPAGRGAAREVCELIMRAQGTLERALQTYLA
ncbi:MAG TPA: phenylphosphate carboxylase subunit delta [Burkholderiales bacterium]|nr:phenylphosphate carboxylase subunit delta [Burkholderiales bacterium]